jgi:hypothetical protein
VIHAVRPAAFLAALAFARMAGAQDFGVGAPHDPRLVTSRLGIETVGASFDLNGNHGDFFGVAVRGDLRLSPTVGLRLVVPYYALQVGSVTSTGLGDAELRLRVLAYEGHPWRVYAGISDQLPTGDSSAGLGQGGSQLTPFVTGGWRHGNVVLYASVADALGLHPDKPLPFDYVDPSSDHELRYTVGGILEITDFFYFNGAVDGVTVLVPGQLGDTFVFGGLAGGLVTSDRSKVVLYGELPFAGDRRFDAKAGLDAYLYF